MRNTPQSDCIVRCISSRIFGRRTAALRVAELVEPGEREIGGIVGQLLLDRAGLHHLG